jgi:hypothetical protein
MTTMSTPKRTLRRSAAVAAIVLCVAALGGCTTYDRIKEEIAPMDDQEKFSDERQLKLIAELRGKGSYEDTRVRLTDSARLIAERISAAIPGQTWNFDDDPNVLGAARGGRPCMDVLGNIAKRPEADPILFGRTFAPDELTTAATILREEAARYGATEGSSLFDGAHPIDEYSVRGSGYEFQIMQMKLAGLRITGECLLLQEVLDLPPGQLPPLK